MLISVKKRGHGRKIFCGKVLLVSLRASLGSLPDALRLRRQPFARNTAQRRHARVMRRPSDLAPGAIEQ
jgi:hypothetical protein